MKVKEILTGLELDEMYEDNAFFYLFKDGELLAMVSSHVDDFEIAAAEELGTAIIKKIEEHLTISKIEKDRFRFTGVDIERTDDCITMSMDDYAASLTKIDHFRDAPKEEELTKLEHKLFRKKVGQLSWLASNARPDLSFPVQALSQKSAKPTIGDLKKINHVVSLAKAEENKIVFRHIDEKEHLQIFGVSDASWSNKGRPVSGTVYMLGSSRNNSVSPLTWKSKTILRPTSCVKDSETRALSLSAENSPHYARMVERLLFGEANLHIPVKCFSDNRPLLESVSSTRSPLNKDMGPVMRYLKDKLRWGELRSYSWLPTNRMIADCLTKEMKLTADVWDVYRNNHWRDGNTNMNMVTYQGLEFLLSNPTTKEQELGSS